VDAADFIWMNGEYVAWDDAKIHVLTHGLHYGTGVFEGVRCYDTESKGPAVFRHAEHVNRLFQSASMYYMDIPFTREQLREATLELIGRNGQRSCYIRPLVYRGYGTMGLFPLDAPVDVSIATWEWGSYLGEEGKANGVRARVSSWRRISPDSLIPQAKATGQYLNSVLAKIESHKSGYEEIYTPPLSSSLLDGINRRSVIQIAQDLGYEVIERNIARAELYLADELYCTGTAAELTPIREVDDHAIGTGRPGEVTRAVQAAFEDALHGRSDRYADWLDPVPAHHFSKVGA
jgi:branched-chain amino acid aminotransferase